MAESRRASIIDESDRYAALHEWRGWEIETARKVQRELHQPLRGYREGWRPDGDSEGS